MMTDHDWQGWSIHGNIEEHANGSDDGRAVLDGMNESESEKGEKGDEDEFWEEAKEDPEPLGAVGVEQEECDIDDLNDTPCTVDGHHQQAVRVYHGEPV